MANPGGKKYPVDNNWQVLLRDMNIPAQDVLRHAQLPLDLLSQKSPGITGEEYFRLWEGLAVVLKDEPAFPLRLAESITVEAFSPPIFACLCSNDLNMALKRISTYKPLVGPCHLVVKQNEKQTTLVFKALPQHGPMPASLIAFELAFWVQVARLATREHIVPRAVYINIELPEIDSYERFFDVVITKDDFNGLTFSARDAQKPFLTVNEGMWSMFEPELRKRLADLTQESTFRQRVRACLNEILASGQYSMSDVASRLAVSPRTLQRRLRAENTSFQQELDTLREELARHYLSSSDYSSGQIAFLLGYEEPNSFFRAFRSWTGQTPETVRESLQ